MDCEEKNRLIAEHHLASLAYSQAVRALRGSPVSVSEEYGQLQAEVEAARSKSQQAGVALRDHVVEHGCMARATVR
jgi:hypothetical protein